MRLTVFSDYALRILMYLAANPAERVTIAEMSKVYGISRSHLMKIAAFLAQHGFVDAVRGAKGGLALGKAADQISVGAVVRLTEARAELVECGDRATNSCIIAPACALKHELFAALDAFYGRLDGVSLAAITHNPQSLRRIYTAHGASLQS